MEIGNKEMQNDESGLDGLFGRYRQSCPDVDPSPHFMPALWQKIEGRHSVPFLFRKMGRNFVTASAALCLFLLLLNLSATTSQPSVGYTESLIAEGSAEQTYYTEAIRSVPASDISSAPLR
jgi:hypothetical protein